MAEAPATRAVGFTRPGVCVEGSTSDDAALLLLSKLGARDLEVSVPSLESAFFALTEESRDA